MVFQRFHRKISGLIEQEDSKEDHSPELLSHSPCGYRSDHHSEKRVLLFLKRRKIISIEREITIYLY
jgi:hypothetical protein